MKKSVKSILFKVEMSGSGIVNFDSNDQKYIHSNTQFGIKNDSSFKNASYAKKHFYRDSEGKITYKIAISSDCLRHDIFKDDVFCQSPNIANNQALLYSYIASPAMLLRGYLFADKKGTFKRKSPITITDAEQTCNAQSFIDTHSSSAKKNDDTERTESDNTFFKKENVGAIKYATQGVIDLMQLQFVSCDQKFDRFAFNPDVFEVYKKFMVSRLPKFDSKLEYYNINGSVSDVPELGLLINDACVIEMVRGFFDRLKNTCITRKDAFAKVDKIQIKLVSDGIYDTFGDSEGWITVTDVNAIDFDVHKFYTICDRVKAEELVKSIDADIEARKKEGVKAKADKKEKGKKKGEVEVLSEETDVE